MGPREAANWARQFLALPPWGRPARLTSKRLRNLYRNRWEHWRIRTALRSYPIKLIVEPTNVCNLHCPCCFTGDGQVGRERSAMSLDLYRSLLAELGDYLFEVEAFNWGEPLLSKHIYTMVAEAAARGIATTVNTNFSLPFDADKAERLVGTGLSTLRVSIDGAGQEVYQQYRVGGNLETVLANCRLMADAKRRLGSSTPQLVWEYHVFPHNVAEVDRARVAAARLGMEFLAFKGQVPGNEWGIGSEWQFCHQPQPMPCAFLWAIAVVHNDGGVAPCNGTFYREDDLGRLAMRPGELGSRSFREVWNGPRYRVARRFFSSRTASSDEERDIVCFNCPQHAPPPRLARASHHGGHARNVPEPVRHERRLELLLEPPSRECPDAAPRGRPARLTSLSYGRTRTPWSASRRRRRAPWRARP